MLVLKVKRKSNKEFRVKKIDVLIFYSIFGELFLKKNKSIIISKSIKK